MGIQARIFGAQISGFQCLFANFDALQVYFAHFQNLQQNFSAFLSIFPVYFTCILDAFHAFCSSPVSINCRA